MGKKKDFLKKCHMQYEKKPGVFIYIGYIRHFLKFIF